MARFSKVFQLLTVALVIAVLNVYVMGAPMRVVSDPNKADGPETTGGADVAGAEVAAGKTVAPVAVAAEKLPLAPNTKVDFNRIFSKREITSRATTSHNFLNAKTAARDIFKAPPRTGTVPPDDSDSDDDGSKGTWIAVGVIAAVLTIAVIGLRHDRNTSAQ